MPIIKQLWIKSHSITLMLNNSNYKVVCVDNTPDGRKTNDITLNKIYKVESSAQKGNVIFITNDKERKEWYNSKLFITLEEYRELKIKQLGI